MLINAFYLTNFLTYNTKATKKMRSSAHARPYDGKDLGDKDMRDCQTFVG
jgi:hypothetical protein